MGAPSWLEGFLFAWATWKGHLAVFGGLALSRIFCELAQAYYAGPKLPPGMEWRDPFRR